MGASLLVFNNKTDVADGMRADEVRKVSLQAGVYSTNAHEQAAAGTGRHHHAHMEAGGQQCRDRQGACAGDRVGAAGCEEPAVLVLIIDQDVAGDLGLGRHSTAVDGR
jgi:hypothetical protein